MMEEKHNKIKKKKLNQKYNSILNHSINPDLTSQNNVCFMSDEEKIEKIKKHFFQIMEILGLDMNDDSLRKTPKRVAKMFIQEIFSGLNPKNTPNFSIFENKYKYNQMLIEKNITVYSTCEHHFLPIIGKAHVGYISNGKVVGLSKINRIVNFYAKRPQVQERLTIQIVQSLKKMLETQDVACIIEAKHLCVNSRGIKDTDSSTVTTELIGSFKNNSEIRKEFLHHIGIS
ncbi:GTP cyclohydrolase I FolE [Blattabacterium cuenoti]|uniref:GTP cyclohydrolase 1 n=1 Tax=Blattabacterium cuenoti BPAY TaxID=1457031 RepID=A0ABM7EXX5_9FLAO|nr:GTP cyclohydrolase I FolE [Blattabacterium cuenoti]BAR91828.1 GTP cyclohydrolase i [Blattabacterium cuenoti BPAY]